MPRDASDGELETEQRRNARRLGSILLFVIAAIVFGVFGWKLGWWDFGVLK